MSIGNINTFLSVVNRTTGFLFSNRYRVTLNKLSGENISTFCSRVELPGIDFAQSDFDIGGKVVHTPNKVVMSDLQLTFYNTGAELKEFYQFCDNNIYMHNTHSIGYYDDIAMDIIINEYNNRDTLVMTRQYIKCILKSISPMTLDYSEATEIQKFSVTFSCGGYNIK